ncbi:MAG: lytic transglycosylase domain-containing protein [Thermoanaerobaculales bacterium]|nr:lytic transglycosylase domain-containing protein [Thermoanaerobaculales bacterium]
MPYTLLVVASLCIAACAQHSPESTQEESRFNRDAALDRGIALRREDPLAAADFLRDAGPGPDLESIRLDVWLKCLEDGGAAVQDWRDFLAQHPPPDLADQARIALARVLLQGEDFGKAFDVLREVASERQTAADTVRLEWPAERAVRIGAARRLAINAPSVLRAEAPGLENEVFAVLTTEEKIQRAVAWRRVGHPRRAAEDLRRLRAQGDLGKTRRLELARSELASGSTSRALSVLPQLTRTSGDEALVHAEAWRTRGWARFPSAGARRAFDQCLIAAERARTQGTEDRIRAYELELECATETGRLDLGIRAWRNLAHEGWDGSLRSWLGRRLGVALAQQGGNEAEVGLLMDSLPNDARCLEYWNAGGSTASRRRVSVQLAAAPFADLYAIWAHQDLGQSPPENPPWSVGSTVRADPPPTVSRLIELREEGLASVEWRRLRWGRGVRPAEAVSAAAFEHGRGREDLGIRWLRRAFPDLGSVSMTRVPEDAVRAYLPLKWTQEVLDAADEAGIEPWLLAGLARQESIFNAQARSPAGAVGLVQLMRTTARGHSIALGFGKSPDLRDPVVNLRLGARELAGLISTFGAVEPALAAYNAGESRVKRWWRIWPNPRVFTEKVPIFETYTYIRRVRFLSEAYRVEWAEEREGEKKDEG